VEIELIICGRQLINLSLVLAKEGFRLIAEGIGIETYVTIKEEFPIHKAIK
jgi:hypothetical protein